MFPKSYCIMFLELNHQKDLTMFCDQQGSLYNGYCSYKLWFPTSSLFKNQDRLHHAFCNWESSGVCLWFTNFVHSSIQFTGIRSTSNIKYQYILYNLQIHTDSSKYPKSVLALAFLRFCNRAPHSKMQMTLRKRRVDWRRQASAAPNILAKLRWNITRQMSPTPQMS